MVHILHVISLLYVPLAESLSYERFRLIDHIEFNETSNFIFRSNEPVSNSTFQYDQIIANAKQRCQEQNITLNEPVYIHDINLLNDIKPEEARDIATEEAFFKENPTLGKIQRWTLIGNLLNASHMPNWLLKLQLRWYMAFNWDKLTTLIPQLHSQLLTQ